jgi:glucose/arabinose dehydrogenase
MRLTTPRITHLVLALLLLAVPQSVLRAQTVFDPNLTVTSHASGFSAPTGVAFLGNSPNDFFVIEKNTGQVLRWDNGASTTVLSLPVNTAGFERGLVGIALDPAFNSSRPYGYFFYSRQEGGVWTENRLSRFTWNGSGFDPATEVPLLSFASDPNQPNSTFHNGGVLAFGPDGRLYGAAGDLDRDRGEQNNQAAAGVSANSGGYFRYDTSVVQPDGTIAGDPFAGNPFSNHANADFHKWYGYGLRNSFGIAHDPVTGDLWSTENGLNGYDEINRVTAGFNSGWRKLMGPRNRTTVELTDLVDLGGSSTYVDPKFSWLATVAPTALTFLHGSNWGPSYDDAVLVGDFSLGRLYLFRLNGARTDFTFTDPLLADLVSENNNEEIVSIWFGNSWNIPTAMEVGPDGAVYALGFGDGILYRISGLASVPEPRVVIGAITLTAFAGAFIYRKRRARRMRKRRVVARLTA